jgi:hypothetical protein
VDFGHHDPQTLHHPTPFCEDFSKRQSTAITQEAWGTLKTTLSRLLPAPTNKLFEKLQKKHLEKGESLSSRRRSYRYRQK